MVSSFSHLFHQAGNGGLGSHAQCVLHAKMALEHGKFVRMALCARSFVQIYFFSDCLPSHRAYLGFYTSGLIFPQRLCSELTCYKMG